MTLVYRWVFVAILLLTPGCGGRHSDARQPIEECPDDMVELVEEDFCIDAYEAALDGEGRAVSRPGGVPFSPTTWDQADAACRAAGKTLCPEEVWQAACTAGGTQVYSYGNEYVAGACADRFVNDDERVPAGSLPLCEGGVAGLFDMSGNVCELVDPCAEPDSSGVFCRCFGGVFSLVGEDLQCEADSSVHRDLIHMVGVGFRCCLDMGG